MSQMTTVLTDEQLSVLRDARGSMNRGGLREAQRLTAGDTFWTSATATNKHRNAVVHDLHNRGLLCRIGTAPSRTASITERGMMELDCAEVAA